MSDVAAYHEAGHIVVAVELGGRVLSASIDPEPPDEGPVLDGDVTVEWPHGRSAHNDVLVALAGPVAETIYRDDEPDPATLTAWVMDYQQASQAVSMIHSSGPAQRQHLAAATDELHALLRRDDIWTIVGDVADALLAHEQMDEDLVAFTLEPWGY